MSDDLGCNFRFENFVQEEGDIRGCCLLGWAVSPQLSPTPPLPQASSARPVIPVESAARKAHSTTSSWMVCVLVKYSLIPIYLVL